MIPSVDVSASPPRGRPVRIAAVLLLIASILCPPLALIALKSGITGEAVFSDAHSRLMVVYPHFSMSAGGFAACVGLPLLTLVALRFCARGTAAWSGTVLRGVSPAAFLPLAVAPQFLPHLFSATFAWNVLFFVPLLVVSSIAARWMCSPQTSSGAIRSATVVTAVVVASVLYCLTGWHTTRMIGSHSGDEGHYRVQALSLHDDGDLDIRNQIADEMARGAIKKRSDRRTRQYLHISRRSRGKHWYSLHPFGLPVLLAPFIRMPPVAIHAILGIIAGLGIGGCLLWCRRWGAGARPAVLCTVLFGLSQLWCMHASRQLPETLGATVCVYLAVSVFAVRHRPWAGLLGTVSCCLLLPWVHARFAPLAAWGGIACVIALLHSPQSKTRRAAQISTLVICSLAGAAFYYCVMSSMYVGASAQKGSLLFSRMLSIWDNLASSTGVLYSLPVFAWMLAAVVVLSGDERTRYAAFYVIISLIVVLLTSCSTVYLTGGTACVPGRFLLVVCPLLVAPAAKILDRTRAPACWLFFLLALVPVAECILCLSVMPRCPFEFPKDGLGRAFFTSAGSLVNPLVALKANELSWHPYAAVLYVGCLGMLASNSRKIHALLLALLIFGAVLTHAHLHPGPDRRAADRKRNAETLSKMDLRHASVVLCATKGPVPLLEFSDLFSKDTAASVCGADLGQRLVGSLISQPRVEVNDWKGRGYRWCTIVAPFRGGRGRRLLWLLGRTAGENPVFLAVREGSRTIYEEELVPQKNTSLVNLPLAFNCLDRGNISILIRVTGGSDTFTGLRLAWSPFSDSMLDRKVALPRGTAFVE